MNFFFWYLLTTFTHFPIPHPLPLATINPFSAQYLNGSFCGYVFSFFLGPYIVLELLGHRLIMGILQAKILEWVTMPSSRGSSKPRDRTQVACIAGRFFTI